MKERIQQKTDNEIKKEGIKLPKSISCEFLSNWKQYGKLRHLLKSNSMSSYFKTYLIKSDKLIYQKFFMQST